MSNVQLTITESNGRQLASSGSKWEPIVGYSRAVRIGAQIAVTGTVGVMPNGEYPATLAEQSRRSLEIIQAAIEALGGKMTDVIRTRIFVTDISEWEQVARVHGEVFSEIRPATTLVEVARLIDNQALVEIEADAVCQ